MNRRGFESRYCSRHASKREIPLRFDTFGHAFGLALLQLEADDEAMEEDELQEDEKQLNMHCGVAVLAAAIPKCMLSPAPSNAQRTLSARPHAPLSAVASARQRPPAIALSRRIMSRRDSAMSLALVRWPAWHACRSVCAARCVRTDACISSGSGAARNSRQVPIDIVVHERRLQILAVPRPSLAAPPRRHSAWCRRAVGRF